MPRQLDHDRVVSQIAASCHGVVTRARLIAEGVPESIIDERVRSRRLVAVHRGVYALGHSELRREGQWFAAVEAYGKSAALSHGSAAALWDIYDAPLLPIHVTVAKRSGIARRKGTCSHRVSDLPSDEVVTSDGVRVTSVARTILDLAAQVRGRHLEQVIRRASRQRVFDLRAQCEVLERHPHRPGVKELRGLLHALAGVGTVDLRSRMEVAFMQLCDDYGLSRPVANGYVLGERVDFQWPGTTLVVETDGFEFHAMPTAFADDRRRDQKLTLAGFTVVRLTWMQVTRDQPATARMVRALLRRCGST